MVYNKCMESIIILTTEYVARMYVSSMFTIIHHYMAM